MLEITGTVSARNMQAQLLDSMDLERERGITIKAQAVRMSLDYDGREYEVNLIDTPGHVDFSYEVSRSLAACEGALLVVDASQGIQAQTLANVYLAMEHDLTIIPVVNKIDLPAAEPGRVIEELSTAFGFQEDEVLRVSAKDGSGVRELLEAVIERVPPPQADAEKPLRALVFDSKYDSYKGVMAYVRVIDGQVTSADRVMMMATGTQSDLLEVGVFKPTMTKVSHLAAGEVGYLATGLKSVGQCRVGDTITLARGGAEEALPGYGEQKPMVFAGLYPSDGNEFHDLREALERLQMNDAALVYEPENSPALGPGFRCGFSGSAAYGDRAGAAGARVRDGPRGDCAKRGVSRSDEQRHCAGGIPSHRSAVRRGVREGGGAVVGHITAHAVPVHGADDGPHQLQARRVQAHRVPR